MSKQTEEELAAFMHFVDVAGIPVVAGTVEKRQPPEPDLRCRLSNGELLAFELVEICNPDNARWAFSATDAHAAIVEAYDSLPSDVHNAFSRRFIARPLSFQFHRGASLNAIKRVLSTLFAELVTATAVEDQFTVFSETVARVVRKVRLAGLCLDPASVSFNIGGEFDASVPLEAISAKFTKSYCTDCPIELLAYFGAFAWTRDGLYRQRLLNAFRERGVHPFRRVWVIDSNGVALEYPADERLPGAT